MEHAKECPKFDVKLSGNVTVWPKWQIVIPKDVREQLNIQTGDSLVVVVKWWIAIWLIKNEDIQKMMEYIKSEMGSQMITD